jgi:protoporphyrinogen IX oxidase
VYNYLKALHIIFIVTWFAGLFYIVRLFIYNREAQDKPEPERGILQAQFNIMIRRLWLGITWPSAILTLILGTTVLFQGNWDAVIGEEAGQWLVAKLVFVILLYGYHFTLHRIYSEQMRGIYKYSSQGLRLWNEVATVFLVAIVILVSVKQGMSWAYGLGGLVIFVLLLMAAIGIYKKLRKQ